MKRKQIKFEYFFHKQKQMENKLKFFQKKLHFVKQTRLMGKSFTMKKHLEQNQ